MAIVKPFAAVRPVADYAEKVAALPYDVMTSGEAREMVRGNPYSFLHVDKAEIDLPVDINPYDDCVYQKARKNLDQWMADQILLQDDAPGFYLYRLVMDGRAQTGIVGCCAIDDYLGGTIKKHEFTRADKEADRIRHVDVLDANTGPIFLTCRPQKALDALVEQWITDHTPLYDFIAEDGIAHTVWHIHAPETVHALEEIFAHMQALYIADGHHRCASAVKVGQKRREHSPAYTGQEEFNFFLSVIFPCDQLHILDYNRVVTDLAGHSPQQFLQLLEEDFVVAAVEGKSCYRPDQKHVFGLYLQGQWYRLAARTDIYDPDDPVERLDVSILQNRVLARLLGINDPRTDQRIDFVGGIRGLEELEQRVERGMAAAFSLYPTGLDDLMAIADAGKVMPPKSTWFEPKLRSGLLIHKL